jgi:hypothetical protein
MVIVIARQKKVIGINKTNKTNHNQPHWYSMPLLNWCHSACQSMRKIKSKVKTIKAIDKRKANTIIKVLRLEKKVLLLCVSISRWLIVFATSKIINLWQTNYLAN